MEYNVEEMERGNLSLTELEAAAFRLPDSVKDIENNNNEEVTVDNNLGLAIETSAKSMSKPEDKQGKQSKRPARRISTDKKMTQMRSSPRSPAVRREGPVKPGEGRSPTKSPRRLRSPGRRSPVKKPNENNRASQDEGKTAKSPGKGRPGSKEKPTAPQPTDKKASP